MFIILIIIVVVVIIIIIIMIIIIIISCCLLDTGRGTLYTSDSTGVVFSESLANHLYPNYEDLTDFYRVLSMRGIYIASQLLEDDSIHTMITFDRGGEWQPIRRPEGVPCKDETKVLSRIFSSFCLFYLLWSGFLCLTRSLQDSGGYLLLCIVICYYNYY